MSDLSNEKKGFLDTPYPQYLLKPVQALWKMIRGGKPLPELSDHSLRSILLALAIASLPVIWIFEGLGNPLNLLVDIPWFSFLDYPQEYRHFYLVFLPFFTMLFMYILEHAICCGKEFSLFSINGILCWLTGLSLGILADAFTRNIFLGKFYIPLYNKLYSLGQVSLEARFYFILILIALLCALYFSLRDMTSSTLSMICTPYILIGYQTIFSSVSILRNTLIMYLVTTLVLKLILTILEKIGLLDKLSTIIIRYCYTPRYMPRLWMYVFLIFLWPLWILYLLFKRSKKVKNDPKK